MVGIDIGGSTTKAVVMRSNGSICAYTSIKTTDPVKSAMDVLDKLLKENRYNAKQIRILAITGGGARRIDDTLMNIPVHKVDEITSIGLGGVTCAGKEKALVVSMGTGTAMVTVYNHGSQVKHVGGTGVGGGTLTGLMKLLLHKEDIETLEKLAMEGDSKKVDLTVKDIAGGPVGRLSENATASNFGKASEGANEKDLAAAIFNIVAEVIAVVLVFAAKAFDLESDVVLTGKLANNPIIMKKIVNVCEAFHVQLTVPKNGEYCTAIGAAISVLKNMRGLPHS